MRVLFLSSGIRVGGFSKSLVYMIERLESRGIMVDLLLLRRTSDEWLLESLESTRVIDSELGREFSRNERSLLRRLISMLRSGRLLGRIKFELLKVILYRNREIPRRVALKASQGDDARRALALRSHLDLRGQYDCVVSWEESLCNYILATRIEASRKIGYVHPDYFEAGFDDETDGRFLAKLDAVALVSDANRESFCDALPSLANKAITIPNVLSVSMLRQLALAEAEGMPTGGGEFTMISVCRLQNVSKALDRAARLCAQLKLEGYSFKWLFVGSGPDEEVFRRMVHDLDVQDCLLLLGEKRNPYPYVKKSDLLVLQSYYEGRPLVVDEAKIIGTPVLVTNYSSARTQVLDGAEGLVVENREDAILEGLRQVLEVPSRLDEIRQYLRGQTWGELTDCAPFVAACDG